MAQIAVIGLGRFGFHVARQSFLEGHEVLAIGIEAEAVQAMREHSSRAVCLDATERDKLEALGLRDFDVVVVSVGERVDASAIIVLHLRELGVKRIIAKAGSPEHGRLLRLIGAHEVLFPEREVAERLARRLRHQNLLDFVPLGDDHAIENVAAPPALVGRTLRESDLRRRLGVQVLAVITSETGKTEVNPSPDRPIAAGDELVVLGTHEVLERLRNLH